MKKNFFKKLSFVMALAMIISAIAPAASAFAAASPKLNADKKYLHLSGQPGSNEFDFNIANKQAGSKYAWSVADEKVAVVDESNGVVTAAGVGSTKVSVVITFKNGKTKTLTADVVVRDNIETVKVSNAPTASLAIGQEYDFNRTFVTLSGNTKKTSSVTRWSVDSDKATISDAGVFKATEAGTYKVTALAFQSAAKFDEYKVSKDASLVLDTDEVSVVVKNTMKAEQTDLDSFKVTFGSPVTDAATKLVVAQVIGTAEVVNTIKKVTMSADNKVATVDLYTKFVEKSTYVVSYGDLDDSQFVAATSEAADIVSAKVLTTAVEAGDEKVVDVALYNKDGVNVADDELIGRLTFEYTSNAVYKNGNKLTMFTAGDTTNVTVTYHTYNYDTATGTEVGNVTATGVISCVADLAENNGTINAFTITSDAHPNWNGVTKTLAVDDAARLFVRLLLDADDDNEIDDYIDNDGSSLFNFTTTNTSVLIVDENTGNLFPVAAGTATVIVKYNDNTVGTVNITVSPKREVASVTLDAYNFILSNDADTFDRKTVAVTVKDQLGENLDASKYWVSLHRSNTVTGTEVYNASTHTASGKWDPEKFTFGGVSGLSSGTPANEGTHAYYVEVVDRTSYKTIKAYVTVTVKAPTAGQTVPSRWIVETDSQNYDTNLEDYDTSETVTVSIFGLAANGIKMTREAVAGGIYRVTVKAPYGSTTTLVTPAAVSSSAPTDAQYALTPGNPEITKREVGTYTITAVNTVSNQAINSTYFTVKNSQEAPSVVVDKLYTTQTVANAADTAGLEAAVADCFDFMISGV
jgi:hypothetical protein